MEDEQGVNPSFDQEAANATTMEETTCKTGEALVPLIDLSISNDAHSDAVVQREDAQREDAQRLELQMNTELGGRVKEHAATIQILEASDLASESGKITGIEETSVNTTEAELPSNVQGSHLGIDGPTQDPLATAPSSQQTGVDEVAFLHSTASMMDPDGPRIQAFAKLEFDDGQFYMNTYSVELGRDIRAARMALQQDLVASQVSEAVRCPGSSGGGDASRNSRKLRREESRTMASSVVSESGGIMNLDAQDQERTKKIRHKKPKSVSSSSNDLSRKNSILLQAPRRDYQSLAYASLHDPDYDAHPVDTLSLMPSPDECPLIPIHPPTVGESGNTGHRGISRRHARIAYNFEKRLFELVVMGKNGAFVDDQFHSEGEIAELKSGSYIQIGGVGVRFVLPDVATGETGAEGNLHSDAISGGAMSFDFEDGRGESVAMVDSSASESSDFYDTRSQSGEPALAGHSDAVSTSEDEEDEEDEETTPTRFSLSSARHRRAAEGGRHHSRTSKMKSRAQPQTILKKPLPSIKLKLNPPEPSAEPAPAGVQADQPIMPQKRKGPGRPPKNGIMSKREQALLARQAKLAAKAEAIKDGTLKPENESIVENGVTGATAQPEKRKYTKRRKVEDQADDSANVQESIERDEPSTTDPSQPTPTPKPTKEKRAPKPPRSPSPVFDEATLTPEQLAKPTQSYVVLIHEALSNSPTGQMSLPQIYRAIERRYPYYKLKVHTLGWQSSVRHNLSQHAAFTKVERDGKGWMWGLVPEVSIEKEKKRRPSPPPMPPPQFFPPGPHMFHPPYPYHGMPPLPHGQLVHPPYHMFPHAPPPGRGFPPPGLPRGPHGLPLPLAAPQHGASTTYQSPYTSTTEPKPQPLQEEHARSDTMPPPNTSSAQQAQSPPPFRSPVTPHDASVNAHYVSSGTAQPSPVGLPSHCDQQVMQHPEAIPPNPQSIHSTSVQPHIPTKVLDAVSKFKTALIGSLTNTPNADEIVTRAINRCLGIPQPPGETNGDFREEEAIIASLRPMLEQLKYPIGGPFTTQPSSTAVSQGQRTSTSPAASSTSPANSMTPNVHAQSDAHDSQSAQRSLAQQQEQTQILEVLSKAGPSFMNGHSQARQPPLANRSASPASCGRVKTEDSPSGPSSLDVPAPPDVIGVYAGRIAKRDLEDEEESVGLMEQPQMKRVAV